MLVILFLVFGNVNCIKNASGYSIEKYYQIIKKKLCFQYATALLLHLLNLASNICFSPQIIKKGNNLPIVMKEKIQI